MEEINNVNYDAQKQSAVKRAITSKSPKIITDNLETNFQQAIKNKSNPNFYASQLSASGTNGVRKHGGLMRRSANSFSIDRVFDAPHNPFRNRLAVETPANMVEMHQRFRYYFKYEPLVGTAIELHSEFPLSSFQLKHEDPTLQEDFNQIAEDLKLFEFQLDMAHEYWLVGEAIPFGIFDDPKQPSEWKAFVLLNPLNVDISSVPITDGRPNTIMRLQVDQSIRQVVENGPSHKQTGELYKRLPSDLIQACKGDGFLPLNPMQASHFKRKGSYFKVRGESLLNRIVHLLNYRDKLRDAQYTIADRHITPREIYKVGTDLLPATEDELQALADMVASTYLDPNQAIIWHHALQVDVIGTADKVLPLRQELDGIEEEMLIGLMLNKGFLDSGYGAYANMSVALDVLIARYLTFRQRLEQWQKDSVWAPLCRIHNIYKPTQAELSHRIRVKNNNKRPWVPNVVWNKYELRDNTQRINLLLQLREKMGGKSGKPGYPKALIYQAINENPETIKRMLEKEAKEDEIANKSKIDLGGGKTPTDGLPDLNIDAGGLGGGAPAGGGGAGELNIDDAKLPEFNGAGETKDLGTSVKPPESQTIENENSSTGGAGSLA